MLNQADIQALRAKGTSNSEILKMMGRVVPSAAKAYADMEADQRTSAAVKDSIIGKMLDEQTPKNAPSGLPYMHAVSIASAQKSHDSLEKQYQSFESQQSQSPPDEGFSLGGVAAGIGQNLKAMGRAALGAPMVGTYHLFKTADDLSSFLAGKPPTKLRPDQEQFVKDLHTQAYKDLPQAAMLYSGMGGMSALNIGLTSGGIASGQKALAKAGVAPEGMPTGNDVSLLSVPYEGVKAFVDGYTTFTGPLKSVIAKNTLYSAASQVLDGMVYDTPQKSMGKLLQDSLASGITSGLVYKGMEKMRSANAVKDFINEKAPDVEAPKMDGEDVSAGGRSVIPGEQFNPSKPPTVGQSTIEQLSGLRPQSQEVAFDPQGRAMVDDFRSGKVSPQKLVLEDLANNFKKTMDDVSDMGKEYNFVRSSKQSMFLPVDDFRAVLKKYDYAFIPDGKPKSNPVDGLMTQPGTVEGGAMAKPISGEQFNHLTMAMNILEAPSVTPQMMRTAKSLLQDLGKFYDPKLPGGGGDARAMAGELLSVLEGARRSPDAPSDFRKYAELDDKYAPLRKEYDRIKDEFFESDALTGELRMKDNAPAKILNSLRGTKYNLLERLETASPGITRKIRAYEAYRDIVENNKPGQYVKAGAKMAGQVTAIGGVASLNPAAIGAGIVGILASSPAVMWSALTKYAQITEAKGWDPLGIVMKAEHGAPFTPEEAAAVQGTVRVITQKYAMPQETKAPNAEARLVNLKGGQKGTPGIDFPAQPPKVGGVDMLGQKIDVSIDDRTSDVILSFADDGGSTRAKVNVGRSGDAYIADIIVKENKRGTGIGKSLMQALENKARENYATRMIVADPDPDAVGFWKKIGYKIDPDFGLVKDLTANSTDQLASPSPSRHNGDATSPNNMSRLSKKDLMKVYDGKLPVSKLSEADIEFLKYEASNDGRTYPEFNSVRAQDILDMVDHYKSKSKGDAASSKSMRKAFDSDIKSLASEIKDALEQKVQDKIADLDYQPKKAEIEELRQDIMAEELNNGSFGEEIAKLEKKYAKEIGADTDTVDRIIEQVFPAKKAKKSSGSLSEKVDRYDNLKKIAQSSESPDMFVAKAMKEMGSVLGKDALAQWQGLTDMIKGDFKSLSEFYDAAKAGKASKEAPEKSPANNKSPLKGQAADAERIKSQQLASEVANNWDGDPMDGTFVDFFESKAAKEALGSKLWDKIDENLSRGGISPSYIDKIISAAKKVESGKTDPIKAMASEILNNWDGDTMDGSFMDFFESAPVKKALGTKLWDKMDENISMGGMLPSHVEKIYSLAKKLMK